jgi:iron complex transport system substrate-binding protein
MLDNRTSRHVMAGRIADVILLISFFVIFSMNQAFARIIIDSAGRSVEIPEHSERVYAAGPPASVLLYVLKPQVMTGRVRAPRTQDRPFLLPSVRDLPETGRLTGRGNSINLEALLASKADLILDVGSVNGTHKSLADRVQVQTGIPYILIDGRFSATPAALRLLGDILGVKERGETLARYTERLLAQVDQTLSKVPPARRPHLYLARGPSGLETGTKGSINTEIFERVGAINVVEGFGPRGQLTTVSPEQILAWAPDTIVTMDRSFAAAVETRPEWTIVPAVKSKRVFLSPDTPFGFIDAPPSVNRLAGLIWLLHTFYPEQTQGNAKDQIREFYRLFYQIDPSEAQIQQILSGS